MAKKPKLVIFGDPDRPNASEAIERFKKFSADKAEIIGNYFRDSGEQDFSNADFAVAFGGDGTILSAARHLSRAGVPVIGVHVGRLGFLAEFQEKELEELFEKVTTDSSLVEERMIVRCCVEKNGEEAFCQTAINDVVINAGSPFKMVELKMNVGGDSLAACVSDGIIVSTPTGSTAYNLSAGGPILSANLSALVVAPICPHSLSFRPIVISTENKLIIKIVRCNENTCVTLDGQISHRLEVGDAVIIEKHKDRFKVVNNPMRTQWDALASKLNWAEIPKYSLKG